MDDDATVDEIKRAYRAMAKECHPDYLGDEGHNICILLNEAYEVSICLTYAHSTATIIMHYQIWHNILYCNLTWSRQQHALQLLVVNSQCDTFSTYDKQQAADVPDFSKTLHSSLQYKLLQLLLLSRCSWMRELVRLTMPSWRQR